MSLEFSDIIAVLQEILDEHEERAIYDVEISILFCGWHKVTYDDFIKNQEKYTAPYIEYYHAPRKPKSISSFPSASSRLMKILCNHFGINKVYQSNFRETMLALYEQDRLTIEGKDIKQRASEQIENYNHDLAVSKKKNQTYFIKTDHKQSQLISRSKDIKKFTNLLEEKLIVSLYGFSGIGKTFFVNQLCNELQSNYIFYFTDFRYIETFEDWMVDVLSQANLGSEEYKNKLIQNLIELLESKKTIIVIDSIGTLGEQFTAFLESFLLKGTVYKSKIILSSQNRINLNAPKDGFGHYELLGITSDDDINRLFASLGLNDRQYWNLLSEKHQGNLRELTYVAKFIKDFFKGNVSEYLNLNSFFISPELKSIFSKIQFSSLDLSIFSMFKNEINLISDTVFNELRKNSRASEIFLRIELLCDNGYLIKEEQSETGVVSYTVMPLLKSYLIQEKLIDA